MSKRRKFSDEFKREAVGLIRQPGAQLSKVARDIGVGAGGSGALATRAGDRQDEGLCRLRRATRSGDGHAQT